MRRIYYKICKSLALKVSICLTFVVSICFIVIFSANFQSYRKTLHRKVHRNASDMLQIANLNVEMKLSKIESSIDNLEQAIVDNIYNPEFLYYLTYNTVKINSDIYGCSIALEPYFYSDEEYYFAPYSFRDNDSIVTRQSGCSEYDYFVMDKYLIPKLLEEAYWSEPYVDNNKTLITYSVPIYDSDSTFMGIFSADISLDLLTQYLNSMKLFPNSYSFVISKSGTYVLHRNVENIFNISIFSLAMHNNDEPMIAIGQKMVDGETGSDIVNINKEECFIFYSPIPTIDWSIAIVCPSNEILRDLNLHRYFFIMFCIIGILLITIGCYLIINKMLNPIRLFAISANEIAKGNLDAKLPTVKSKDEMRYLHDAFGDMQIELKNYINTLHETITAKQKIESELRIAKEIQMSMIPKTFPPFPDRNDIDLYATLTSAKEVGGDLYDFFIQKGKFFFVIGDVSGKGVPASLVMAITCSLYRIFAKHISDPKVIIEMINSSLSKNNEANMFVTLFTGVLDMSSGRLTYCNAGHNPPYILKADSTIEILPTNPNIPVGVFNEYKYENQETKLQPGDVIFLYTDGLTEAENDNAELYSEKRLTMCLKNIKNNAETKEIVDCVQKDVINHVENADQSDDLTMMAIKYKVIIKNEYITIENEMSEMNKVHDFVDNLCMDLNLNSELTMSLNLAVEEIVANVIMYAYENSKNKKIDIAKEIDENGNVIFTIIDSGIPFDPIEKSDPDINMPAEDRPIGGLGIFIVKQIMDEVKYFRVKNLNILKMKKYINK